MENGVLHLSERSVVLREANVLRELVGSRPLPEPDLDLIQRQQPAVRHRTFRQHAAEIVLRSSTNGQLGRFEGNKEGVHSAPHLVAHTSEAA